MIPRATPVGEQVADPDATAEQLMVNLPEAVELSADAILAREDTLVPQAAVEKKRRPSIVRVRAPSFARARSILLEPQVETMSRGPHAAATPRPLLPALPPPPLPCPPAPRRSRSPSLPAAGPVTTGAGSVAPLALDVATAPPRLTSLAPGLAPPRLPRISFESLPELSHPAPKPRSFWRMALLSGVSAALAVFCVQVVRVSQGAPAAREATVPALPRVPQVYAARELAILDALTAAGKAGEDRQAVPVAVSSLGRLRVPAAARGVLVDGVPHRVTAGVVLVTCGTHRIKLASEAAQTVAIPCGGTTVL